MRTALVALLLLALPVAAQPADAPVATVEFEDGQLRQGSLVLTPREFFVRVGRADLVARSDQNLTRRRWLMGSGIAFAVVAAVVGAVILALTPNSEAPYCLSSVARYNECTDHIAAYNHGGLAVIGGGIAVGAALATIGLRQRPEVLSNIALEELVEDYNRQQQPR